MMSKMPSGSNTSIICHSIPWHDRISNTELVYEGTGRRRKLRRKEGGVEVKVGSERVCQDGCRQVGCRDDLPSVQG